jgi:hypothetical protein
MDIFGDEFSIKMSDKETKRRAKIASIAAKTQRGRW